MVSLFPKIEICGLHVMELKSLALRYFINIIRRNKFKNNLSFYDKPQQNITIHLILHFIRSKITEHL